MIRQQILESFMGCLSISSYVAPDKHCFEQDTLDFMGTKLFALLGRRPDLDIYVAHVMYQHVVQLKSKFQQMSTLNTTYSPSSPTLQELFLRPIMAILSRLCSSKRFVHLFTAKGGIKLLCLLLKATCDC